MLTFVITLCIIVSVVVTAIRTQVYLPWKQTEPIHERNWRSESLEILSKSMTDKGMGDKNCTH